MQLTFDAKIRHEFPGLITLLFTVEDVEVGNVSNELEKFKAETLKGVRTAFNLETLKDLPLVRAYRDFFWRVGIDPTKTRPASEALLRRVLQGKEIPRINTLVDSYNMASMKTMVPLAVFDAAKLKGDLTMRMAVAGEKFLGIGMTAEETLTGKEVVIQDGRGLVATYPYRDAERSKVTLDTKDVVVLVCGIPEVQVEHLEKCKGVSADYITRFCGGRMR